MTGTIVDQVVEERTDTPRPDLLVVQPVFAERLWGGTTLRGWFGAAVPDREVGECWAVSGMAGMSGLIGSDPTTDLTLRRAWAEGLVTGWREHGDFPLLCKLLDTSDWLSVQVHPDDAQARAVEGQPRGKTECWLVLSAEEGSELILGHAARSQDELRAAFIAGTILDHLVKVPVARDDFFLVRAGEVHSLGPGLLVYEVQQSSDITYRLFDFERVGVDGRERELHVEGALSVATAPHDPSAARTAEPWEAVGATARRRVLVDCPQFRVQQWELQGGECPLASPSYRVLTVLDGSGTITSDRESVALRRGTSLVIGAGVGPVLVAGTLRVITSDPGHELHPGATAPLP